MTVIFDRHIPLEGCFNFRDLGGYRGAEGRAVRWRTLFRADGLSGLTAADLAVLRELGLRTVIDLRTAAELTDRGRVDVVHPDHPDLAYHHLPMVDVLPPTAQMREWANPHYVAEQYLGMIDSGRSSMALALEVLADPGAYPVAYHCMAGKDRTGILSALVLGLLGVAEDDIVGDYALSGEAMDRMMAWMRTAHPDRAEKISDAAAVAVEPASMARFLREFHQVHGSVEDYAAGLGLDGIGGRLRDLLLEPGD